MALVLGPTNYLGANSALASLARQFIGRLTIGAIIGGCYLGLALSPASLLLGARARGGAIGAAPTTGSAGLATGARTLARAPHCGPHLTLVGLVCRRSGVGGPSGGATELSGVPRRHTHSPLVRPPNFRPNSINKSARRSCPWLIHLALQAHQAQARSIDAKCEHSR